jgi:hypothetical protein
VTSRAGGDDLDGNGDQETRPSDIMAAPRQAGRTATRSTSVKTAPPNGNGSDRTARGAVATSDPPADEAAVGEPATDVAKNASSPAGAPEAARPEAAAENGRGARVDDTIADGVPALPADNLRPSRGSRPKDSGQDPGSTGTDGKVPADESPTFSFSRPQSDQVTSGTDDWAPGYPVESAAEPSADDPSAPASSSPLSSSPLSSSPLSSGTAPAGTAPASAEPSAVSPASFAWEMPDPPPNSPSSPTRNFLRAGSSAKTEAPPKTPAAAGGEKKTARGETSVAPKSMPKKAPSKRSARQAHLTVARVEPWSVMKFSFVVSLVAFVILFVAVSVLYASLSGLGVFDSLQRVVSSLTSSQTSVGVNAAKWWSASRILGYTALLGSLNIVLITAMSTIGAVVYNLTSRLVGGVEVTLRETE